MPKRDRTRQENTVSRVACSTGKSFPVPEFVNKCYYGQKCKSVERHGNWNGAPFPIVVRVDSGGDRRQKCFFFILFLRTKSNEHCSRSRG